MKDKKCNSKTIVLLSNKFFRVPCNIVRYVSLPATFQEPEEMSPEFQEAHRGPSNLFTRLAKSPCSDWSTGVRGINSDSSSFLSGMGFFILDFFVFVRRI